MNINKPIYTELTECQDCYKCLRECPVKAIKIENGHAGIVDELCIRCGHCVAVCPAGAKRGRNDLERVKRLLELKSKVYVSVAPSYVTEFTDLSTGQFIAAMKRLGFAGVSETALGAEEVSAQVAGQLQEDKTGISISSACPAVVEYVKKYQPELAEQVTTLLSPVLSHCKLLKKEFGEDIGVVFVGPCLAKKSEADSHEHLLDVAITFSELRQWWTAEHVVPQRLQPADDDVMVPQPASEGTLYPIDGGMIRGIEANCQICGDSLDLPSCLSLMTFSGMDHVRHALEDLRELNHEHPLFIETLACEGGCVNGAGMSKQGQTTVKRMNVLNHANTTQGQPTRDATIDISEPWDIAPVVLPEYTAEQLRTALREVGKYTLEDELNCGGCGYDSCREFARALLDGRAERDMCVGYMRQLAAKKADALIRAMPSGVVLVDSHMRIVECNQQFANILGEEAKLVYEACPGMGGASLTKLAPFAELFQQVLTDATDLLEKEIKLGNAVLRVSVFTIEEHRLVGGILQDITAPVIQKERIVTQAKAVIEHNLETVQKIAYLLGENAAESEVILNSVIESFSSETDQTSKSPQSPTTENEDS